MAHLFSYKLITQFLERVRADWDSNCQLLALRWCTLWLSYPETRVHPAEKAYQHCYAPVCGNISAMTEQNSTKVKSPVDFKYVVRIDVWDPPNPDNLMRQELLVNFVRVKSQINFLSQESNIKFRRFRGHEPRVKLFFRVTSQMRMTRVMTLVLSLQVWNMKSDGVKSYKNINDLLMGSINFQ